MKFGNWLKERRTPGLDWLIFTVLLALSWSVYKLSHGAQWAEQAGFATLFCVLIWMKDESPAGRRMMIGIIVVGTMMSIFLSK